MAPYVDEIKVTAGGSTVVQMPETAVVLAFRTTVAGRSDVIVVGPRTRGSYHRVQAVPSCVRMRLRPGQARAVLGVPVSEVAGRAVPLTDLWGPAGRRLSEQVEAAGDDVGLALTHLAGAVARSSSDRGAASSLGGGPDSLGGGPDSLGGGPDSLGGGPHSLGGGPHSLGGGPDDPLLAAAVRELAGDVRLGEVAGRLGVSERHLRNLFAREVGLSPKHFARISRVRRVLALAGRHRWAAVAAEAGFFDQAHMIGDFREFMGVPPNAYLSGRLPATTPCLGLTRTLPRSAAGPT